MAIPPVIGRGPSDYPVPGAAAAALAAGSFQLRLQLQALPGYLQPAFISSDVPGPTPEELRAQYQSGWNPVVPTLSGGAIAFAFGLLGPRRFWEVAKWTFRNILVGSTVVEAGSWWVAFQSNLFRAGELSHHAQNFVLGFPHNPPLFTADYTWLQRRLNDLPNKREQYEWARWALEAPLADVLAARDRLNQQTNDVAAQELQLLIARVLDLRFEIDRRRLIEQSAARDAALAAAAHLAVLGALLMNPPQGDGLPAVPRGSVDP